MFRKRVRRERCRSCPAPIGRSRRSIRSATVASSIAAFSSSGDARLDHQLAGWCASRTSSEACRAGSQRTRPATCRKSSPSSRDADDAEVQPADLDHLVERIELAEQPLRRLRAEDRQRPVSIDFDGRDHPPLIDVERGEVNVVARDARHADAFERGGGERDARRRLPACAAIARLDSEKRRMAAASSSVIRGLLRTRSSSASLRTPGPCAGW